MAPSCLIRQPHVAVYIAMTGLHQHCLVRLLLHIQERPAVSALLLQQHGGRSVCTPRNAAVVFQQLVLVLGRVDMQHGR